MLLDSIWTVQNQEGNLVRDKPFWNCSEGSFTSQSHLGQCCKNDYMVHLLVSCYSILCPSTQSRSQDNHDHVEDDVLMNSCM